MSRPYLILFVLAAAGATFGLMFLQREIGVQESNVLVRNSLYNVSVSSYPLTPIAGVETLLTFRIEVDDAPANLGEEERLLHVIIANKDYTDFFHTFDVVFDGSGNYRLPFIFHVPGKYRIWTEIDHYTNSMRHSLSSDLLSFIDLNIGQSEVLLPSPPPTFLKHPSERDVHAALDHSPLFVDRPVSLRLSVRTKEHKTLHLKDGEPAIYVLIGPNLSLLYHGHTTSSVEDNYTEITTSFPAPGQYFLWTELYVEGEDEIITVPGSFKVTVPT